MTERIEFKGFGGIDIVGDVRGPQDGPTVVLLHGGGQTRHSWGGTANVLADRGYRAINLDSRGHGDTSWAPDGDYSLAAFARDLEAVLGALGVPAVLVGASLGGLASLLLLGELAPGAADALVLVDVVPRFQKVGGERVGAFMRERMHDGFASLEEVAVAVGAYNPHRPAPSDLRGLAKNLRERDGRWYWHWDPKFAVTEQGPREVTDHDRMTAAARAIVEPMLLVRGRMSDLVMEADAHAFLVDVPHCEYVDVSGAGHMVAGDRNDAFTAAVVDFLAEVASRG